MNDSVLAIWSLLLTASGVLFMFVLKNLRDDVRDKASKDEVRALAEEMRESRKSQEQMHRENRDRLVSILERLPPR